MKLIAVKKLRVIIQVLMIELRTIQGVHHIGVQMAALIVGIVNAVQIEDVSSVPMVVACAIKAIWAIQQQSVILEMVITHQKHGVIGNIHTIQLNKQMKDKLMGL